MTPYEQAKQIYEKEPCANTFEEDLAYYLEVGCVVSLPDVFAMARQVDDAWHVGAYAGDLKKAFDYLPFYLPYIQFERRNKLKCYTTVSLTKKILTRDSVQV